jgi:hypothetical protein
MLQLPIPTEEQAAAIKIRLHDLRVNIVNADTEIPLKAANKAFDEYIESLSREYDLSRIMNEFYTPRSVNM